MRNRFVIAIASKDKSNIMLTKSVFDSMEEAEGEIFRMFNHTDTANTCDGLEFCIIPFYLKN